MMVKLEVRLLLPDKLVFCVKTVVGPSTVLEVPLAVGKKPWSSETKVVAPLKFA